MHNYAIEYLFAGFLLAIYNNVFMTKDLNMK
jgi:hypothetical protein